MIGDPPPLPLLPDGTLPPLALLVRWLARAAGDTATLPALPPGNAILPDLLRLGGIRVVVLPGRLPGGVPACRWEGTGGTRVTLRGTQPAADDLPLHAGALPVTTEAPAWDASAMLSLLDLARLEDASAAVGAGQGAAWDSLLAAGDWSRPQRGLPLAAVARSRDGDGLGAWNPLPIARLTPVTLAARPGPAPWSLRDDAGGRHPVQPVEGPLGPVWLTQLPLGALAGTTLVPDDDALPSQWEVDAHVIDNGRVRAELDDAGRIVRLCWDGVFADLAGPACDATIDGMPLGGTATVQVLEDGPVRARLAIRRETPAGTLDLSYTLYAHEDHLRIGAVWSGTGECWLDHPVAARMADLHLCAAGLRWSERQAASVVDPPMPPTAGIRWAALADVGGRGIAVVGSRPMTVHAHAGHLRLRVQPGVGWALAAPRRQPGALALGQVAEHLAVPGRPLPGGIAIPTAFRLAEGTTLVARWVSRPEGWLGELLLVEEAGARGRAWLFATATQACRVDARGEVIAPLPRTPDGDGWQLDHAPGEVLIIRWR